jgi:hypothetical protein
MASDFEMHLTVRLHRIKVFFQEIFLELAGLPTLRSGAILGMDEEATILEVHRAFATARELSKNKKHLVGLEGVDIGIGRVIFKYFRIERRK